jgi:hypothetical protein
MLAGGAAQAGTQANTNACFVSVTSTYAELDVTLSGTGSPNPATFGVDTITLGSASIQLDVPGAVIEAAYAIGAAQVGLNTYPVAVDLTILGSNTAEGSQTILSAYPDDNGTPGDPSDDIPGFGLFGTGTTTVTLDDDGGTPGDPTDDTVSATPVTISLPIPAGLLAPWTPSGGDVEFSDGGSVIRVDAGFPLPAVFTCNPGTGTPAGCATTPGTDCTGFTPATPIPFETVVVNAPPTAPVCLDESVSVGANQSIGIDLTDNCSDVNSNIDPSSYTNTPLVPASPAGGTLTPGGTLGTFTYDAPATDPGPVTFTFDVSDTTALVSNTATVTITVLANQCDATTLPCDLTQVIVQPVAGTTMTMDKVPGQVIMSPVVLNGQPQVSSGALQSITVTNARGTAAGWDVTGYVTDIGAPGSPTIEPIPGVVISACSAAGSFGLQPVPDRLCIPGDNLAWGPAAVIAHDRIAGDVAHVIAGSAQATDAADWLAQLIAAGAAAPASDTPPTVVPGVDGLGGLQEPNLLCQAPVNQSGGTFQCDASLYLGVPASAGAGNYAGGIVLTLA